MTATVFVSGVTLTEAAFFQDVNDPIYLQVANVKNSAYAAIGDGSNDDTLPIQGAVNTGLPVCIPPGTFKTTVKLTASGDANIGQRIYGAGCVRQDLGTGTNKTIIKPSAAVSIAFDITGSGTSVRGFELSDLTIDMANMPDVSTSIGIRVNTAFENKFRNITFINQGVNKRCFKFEAGAYLTVIENCRGTLVELAGNSLNDAVTTLMFQNCDFDAYSMTNAASISIFGGAIQGTLDKLTLASVEGLAITGCDIEGTGTYLVIGANCGSIYSAGNAWSGFTGTYRTGDVTDGWLTLLDSYATSSAAGASPIFSPTITFGGAAVGVTYGNQGAKYTKVGNQVTVVLDLVLSNKGSSAGNAAIGTLPFAGNSNFSQDFALTCGNSTLTGNVYGRISPSATTVTLLINENGAISNFANTNAVNNSAFRGTFTYFT